MLSTEQKERFSRQILLPEFGEAGQGRLDRSRVLIAGLGGLGSLSSLYLAAAGVGALRLADWDTVSLPDLNRQILYSETDIGRVKTEAAAERLSALNGSCRIEAVRTDICAAAEDLLKGCALAVDATDNLPARRAVNRAAVRLGVPMIYGGIDGFSGSVAVILPGISACFECLFPEQENDLPPREIPAIGPVVGLVASLQCCEAIKLLLDAGITAADRMLMLRVDTGQIKTIQTRRNPDCAVCAAL